MWEGFESRNRFGLMSIIKGGLALTSERDADNRNSTRWQTRVRTAKCHLRRRKPFPASVPIPSDQPGFVLLSGASKLEREKSARLYPYQ